MSYTLLDDLTPLDIKMLKKESGESLDSVDEMTLAQLLFVVGKRKDGESFTWAMSESFTLREIKTYVKANWDLSDAEGQSDEPAPKALGNAQS